MTRFNKSLSLAAILAASVSGAALAQSSTDLNLTDGPQTDVSVSGEVDNETFVNLEEGNIDGETREVVDVDGPMMLTSWTYADVASSLSNGTATSVDVSAMTSGNVMAAKVTDLKEPLNDDGSDNNLDSAIQGASGEIASLRTMIGANADIAAMIEQNGMSTDDVIGVYKTTNGGFEILFDDRS